MKILQGLWASEPLLTLWPSPDWFFPSACVMQVRNYWTPWRTRGTSSSAMSCPCCRPSSILSRYTHLHAHKHTRTRLYSPGNSLGWCVCVCLQGKEPSVRQLALLHFRNIIALNLKLDEALSRPRARVPPSIIQMLLILQVRNTDHSPRLIQDEGKWQLMGTAKGWVQRVVEALQRDPTGSRLSVNTERSYLPMTTPSVSDSRVSVCVWLCSVL